MMLWWQVAGDPSMAGAVESNMVPMPGPVASIAAAQPQSALQPQQVHPLRQYCMLRWVLL